MQTTEEQKKSIEAAQVYLKENKLDIGSQLLFVNLGVVDPKLNGIFGFTIQQGIVPVTEAPIASSATTDESDELKNDLASPMEEDVKKEHSFVPLFDNVLILPETEDYLLKQNDPTYTENGIVLAVGPDCKVVKVGDKIATFVFGMKHATRDGKTYHTIRELPAFIQGKYE